MITKLKLFEDYIDKRTDIRPKEQLQKAVNKIRSLGVKNPFDNSTIIGDDVAVDVYAFDGYLRLSSIMSIDKGKGKASEIMKMVCDIADEFDVTIVLTPQPFGSNKKEILTKQQLIKWYKKYGFVKYHIEDMKRNPKLKIFESIENLKSDKSIFWHGTASQDLRGGITGLHVGTYQAAKEALEATIGIPVKGEWDGKREYGKTKLCGQKRLRTGEKGKYRITGYNCDALENDFYPEENSKKATFSNRTEIPLNCKPIIFPCIITGAMTNSKSYPHSDQMANSMMKGQLKKGNAKSGYYYTNDGEDAGSISAVVPNSKFIEKIEVFESAKSDFEIEMDELLDRGIRNFKPEEIDNLKNPVKEQPKQKEEILKYYQIADNFFNRVLSTDVRNYDLNDQIDLFDITSNEDEVFQMANTIYYMYGVQIDPEKNEDFKLVNIFRKINDKIKK